MASVWLLLPILLGATAWMYFLTLIAPAVPTEKTDSTLKFPSNLQDLQDVAQLIRLYYEVNWIYVLVLYGSAYIYKQTFAIPGTVFLNVLGVLYLESLLDSLSAVSCLLLVHPAATYSQQHVAKVLYKSSKKFKSTFVLSPLLRMFPMSPNWLINVVAPLVGVPLPLFFFTVLIGLGPYVLVCTQAGVILSTLTSLEQLFSVKTALQMALLALAALTPSIIFKKPESVQ